MGESLTLFGESLILDGRRALILPSRRIVAIADLHLGKAEAFQKRGMAVPVGNQNEDLRRLQTLVEDYEADQLYILGDFVHEKASWSKGLELEVDDFLQRNKITLKVIRGNHDRGLRLPSLERLELHEEEIRLNNFSFRHEPASEMTDYFTICGHLHPVVQMRSANDALRLPCFWLGQTQLMLPAFTSFAGGWLVEPKPRDKLFAAVEGQVLEIRL